KFYHIFNFYKVLYHKRVVGVVYKKLKHLLPLQFAKLSTVTFWAKVYVIGRDWHSIFDFKYDIVQRVVKKELILIRRKLAVYVRMFAPIRKQFNIKWQIPSKAVYFCFNP